MPYRKKTKTTRPRRGRKRYNRKKTSNKVSIRTMTTGFPDRARTKLKYSDIMTITTGAGGVGLHVFRGNSIFDPDQTGVGHQPMYHDNYENIYQRYLVRGAKCQIKAVNHSGTDSCILMLVASTDQFAMGDVNAQTTLEQNYSKRTAIMSVASQNPTAVSLYCSTSKVLGLRKGQIISDDLFGAHFGASPTDLWYFNIGIVGMNATVGVPIRIQILITYYIECFDRSKQSIN